MVGNPTYEELDQRIKELEKEVLGYKQREKIIVNKEELNRELKAITEIIQHMLQEEMDDSQTELNVLNTCLISTNSIYGMIGRINKEGNYDTTTYSSQTLEDCAFPEALAWELSTGMAIRGIWGFPMLHNKPLICNDPTIHPDRVGLPERHVPIERFLGVPLRHRGKAVGMVAVANKSVDYTREDKNTLVRLTAVISASTQYRQVLINYKQADDALKKKTNDLSERVKELKCLYDISNLIEKPDISLDDIIRGTVNLIPPAWRYPEITCGRIRLEAREYLTANFRETAWKQSKDIIVHGETIGSLEICYLQEKPELDEGPFLKEERNLINAIAERLGRIIERKQAEKELRDAQEELIRKEKLATIGKLSGSIAHEIRNPLGVIDSSAYYLKKKLKEDDQKVHEHLDRIKSQVSVATAIIESLLNLTRIREPKLERVDLKVIASEGITTFNAPDTVDTVLSFPEEEVLVSADRDQLSLAFKNIVANAVDAMAGEGTLTVTVCRTFDEWAELSFADTGPGIDPENLDMIFEPLFSTKTKGIGFGLSIAKMVIEKHGGTVEARSEPERGTTIIARLPLYGDRGKEE